MATLDAEVEESPPYIQASQTLDDGDTMDLKPGEQGIDTLEIHTIAHGNDCDVTIGVDVDNDGTYNREVTIDSFSGSGISQGNEIEIGSKNMRLRITDTSGGTGNDYIITGELLR